ncbi:MAG: phosphoribosylamine--glycine ligase [Gammaproteobacteria bacterium]|nr:phosphoribosylamine--glycine ligase [Gammaproteobacteria bacterium]
MNILVIGTGGREHALVKQLKSAVNQPKVFCYGPYRNPGIAILSDGYRIGDLSDVEQIKIQAQQWKISLVLIGPEAPLRDGVADALWHCNIPTIGPRKYLAQIETSKAFARHFMNRFDIPGAPRFGQFNQLDQARPFLEGLGDDHYVIKADGLMSGKGVKVAGEHLFSQQEALAFCQSILAQNQSFVIEEKLIGQEFSLMCFCDGKTLVPMPVVQDHKRAFVNDQGPNTGGMGSYSDADHRLPFLTEDEIKQALAINQGVIDGFNKAGGDPYIGILYGSFIATAKGVFVIEFNARFGDPEIFNVLSILETDLLTICNAMVNGTLHETEVRFKKFATVCKYLVPQGYPDQPQQPRFQPPLSFHNTSLFLAGINETSDGLFATGARTAAFVGRGKTITEAHLAAEEALRQMQGAFYYREDIGSPQLIEKKMRAMAQLRISKCA